MLGIFYLWFISHLCPARSWAQDNLGNGLKMAWTTFHPACHHQEQPARTKYLVGYSLVVLATSHMLHFALHPFKKL